VRCGSRREGGGGAGGVERGERTNKRVEDYTAGGGGACFSRQFVQKNINHTYGDSSDAAVSYACMNGI